MDMAKLRTPLCIAAGACFALYMVLNVVGITTTVSNAVNTASPLSLILNILDAILGIAGAALAAIGLFTGKKGMLGAGSLVMAFSEIVCFLNNLITFLMFFADVPITPLILLYPLLGAAALVVLAVASFSGSGSRVAPIVACVIWAIAWLMPLLMAGRITILPWAAIAVTAAMVLIIVAWPLPGKAPAAPAGRPAPVKAAAPAMTAGELEQYGKLYEAGALTKEEFEAIRKRYLES